MRFARFLAVLFALAVSVRATTFLIEPELFNLPGGWEQTSQTKNPDARSFLTAGRYAKDAPVAGGVEIPHAGKWRLWVRSKDFPKDRPGTRNFSVRVGGQRSAVLFGKHAREEFDGWSWEDGGVLELPAGPALVVIGEEVTSSARCDALVLSDNQSYTPAGPPWKLSKEAAKLVPLEIVEESQRALLPPRLESIAADAVATLQNESVRFTFHRAHTAGGEAIALRVETRDGTAWQPLADDAEPEGYRVLFRPLESDPKIVPTRVYPTWDMAFSPFIEAQLGAASVHTRLGIVTAPWASAKCLALRPIAAEQKDEHTVELAFAPHAAGQLHATWRLTPETPSAAVELRFTPSAPGHYSLGYHGPVAAPVAETDFVLLPFMFHGHRLPERPATLLNALTPTPLSLVARGGVSCAVVAEPAEIPFEWPTHDNSRYALALRNETGRAQPMIYSPVLGLAGSRSDGSEVKSRLRLWVQRGDWNTAYQRIAREVFGLHDYRQPVTASLSDTALNLLDLMRNEEAAGWDARAKGPWNIESRNTVSQSSPLVYLSLYLLTGDEDFYRRFARPSLEFLLSRGGPHFAAKREIWNNYYTHQPMAGPRGFFGASTFASAFAMTHGRSPVFGALCLDEKGAVRIMHGGHTQPFADLLALYHTTGDRAWLDQAVAAADRYIAANLTTLPTRDVGPVPFFNVSFVPDWESLLHLYEATGEPRFLAAAQEGARWLTTSLWTQPVIPSGDMTIHPGGQYDANRHIWWFGDKLFRRGLFEAPASDESPKIPPAQLPEKRVPAWQVSQVGVGFEQPITYLRRGPQANILMSVWAPSMLRVAGLAKEEPLRTAARNATIGRFTNYPGYYLDGFTDAEQRPDYPVKGPDVTSLYVHHVPPFAGYVLDYLFTDAEMRSGGAVKFPATRQCGYVWFDSRLYGHAPGSVYGESAWPWLHRTAATVDTINVDRVLAEGGGKFHVVLLNQVRKPQTVRVRFDEKVLGRAVEGATLAVRLDNEPAAPVIVKNGFAEIALRPLGIAALTLDGVKIDVPTHRVTPPAHVTLPKKPAQQRAKLGDSALEAVGTVLQVPPFTWRDLYVYLTASIDDCRSATLRYRVGDGPEQRIEKHEFPWEFSVRTEDLNAPITWQLDAVLSDGRTFTATP